MTESQEDPSLAPPKGAEMLATTTFMNRYISQRVIPDDLEEKELCCSPELPSRGAFTVAISPPPPPPPPPRQPVFVSHDTGKRQSAHQKSFQQGPTATPASSRVAAECPICWDEGVKLVRMPTCQHSFCHDCVRAACATSAAAGKLVVPCPGKDCDQGYLPAALAAFLTPKTALLFQANCQRMLEFDSLACPTCMCPAKRDLGDSLQSRPGGVLMDHSCERAGCDVSYCLRCGQLSEAHEARVCESALAKTEEEEDLCASQDGAQRCPHCLIYTVKDVGCDWIKCGRCSHEWCWGTHIPLIWDVGDNAQDEFNRVIEIFQDMDIFVAEQLRLERAAQQRKKVKAVAIGAGLVVASPVLLVAGIAALAVAPFAAIVAVPVVAGVAVKRRIKRCQHPLGE